ncbi:D-inositol-3-phosphate glycosyltransferase (fragment) [Micrococcus luteus]|uniref:glycosyltransferase family 4 protein n=1 Tax=Micrococcus TaxID=1269 RepID=UPI0012F15764
MEGVDRLLMFSSNQVRIFTDAGIDPKRLHPVLFGVDERFYHPSKEPRRFQVLAAGVDRGRDWQTLVEAARLLPHIRFELYTRPETVAPLAVPSNMTVHAPVGIDEHRHNLQSSDLVVVPTHDLAYPTGQSVMLEAMASGACVAVTATEAMADYQDDGVSTLALPLHDPEGVASVIEMPIEDAALRRQIAESGRAAIEERFTFTRMWDEIRQVVRDVARDGASTASAFR